MSDAQPDALLPQAIEHHRAGRLQQAHGLYQQILRQQPDHAEAMHLLGIVALQANQPAAAVDLISRSLQRAPNFAAFNNLGEALRASNRLDEAIAAYSRSIELNPQHADALANLSIVLVQRNRMDDAIRAMDRALTIAPNRAEWHNRLGRMYLQSGDAYRAAMSHRKAIEVQPNFAEAHANLGIALSRTGKSFDEAIASARRAIELAPQAAEAHGSLGAVLDRASQPEQAVRAFEEAARLNPRIVDFFGHRGSILDTLGRLDEAIAVVGEGICNIPTDPRLLSTRSTLHRKNRQYPEALSDADAAIKLAPNYTDAHGNRALALLSLGDYQRGFVEYEWRWRCDNFTTAPRDFGRPMWDGSDPKGRTILVHAEQGYGDVIQFARYIPMLAARGATVIVEVNHVLRKLMARLPGVSRTVAAGLALPDFDLHTPLLSLPRAFGTTIDTIPHDVPYLHPDPEQVEQMRERIARDGSGRRTVGLVWAGNAHPDPLRTVPADALKALAGIPETRFVSLQRRDAATYQPPPAELDLIDLAAELSDFDDTAAAMQGVDLVLTIDTAAAHLAGALGRPTWTLIPFAPDWRWMIDRDDSPWYPTMRLFRQSRPGDWDEVLQRVRRELSAG